jgi:hypothetical protein
VLVAQDDSVIGRFNLVFVEDGVAELGYRSQSMSPDGAWQLQPCATCAGSRPRATGSDGCEPLPPTPMQHRSVCCRTPGSFLSGQPIQRISAESWASGISVTLLQSQALMSDPSPQVAHA